MRTDPYPGTAFLTDAQVRKLMGIRSRVDWQLFLEATPYFPKKVQVGVTRKKQPRLRYKKDQVMGFIDLTGA